MTRIAPTLTLLAVAALGGGMFVANAINAPASAPVTSPPRPRWRRRAPTGPEVIDLSQLPVVGAAAAPPAASVAPVAGPGERTEISLADVPVVGAPAAGGAAPADQPGESGAYAGRTEDGRRTVALAVQDGRASGYVCGAGIEAWLTGTADGARCRCTSKSGRTVLTGKVGGSGVDGVVTIDGAESAYTAAATDVATAAANGRPDVGKVVQRLGGTG